MGFQLVGFAAEVEGQLLEAEVCLSIFAANDLGEDLLHAVR